MNSLQGTLPWAWPSPGAGNVDLAPFSLPFLIHPGLAAPQSPARHGIFLPDSEIHRGGR